MQIYQSKNDVSGGKWTDQLFTDLFILQSDGNYKKTLHF